jgi:hypothetical protein
MFHNASRRPASGERGRSPRYPMARSAAALAARSGSAANNFIRVQLTANITRI